MTPNRPTGGGIEITEPSGNAAKSFRKESQHHMKRKRERGIYLLSGLIDVINMLRILAVEGNEEDDGDWIPERQEVGA